MCAMILKPSTAYYVHQQNSVFCTFLDATRAFDKIHYCKPPRLLTERELPAVITRLMVNAYTQNFERVSWHDIGLLPDYFSAFNGVKQGAVLSPVLSEFISILCHEY
jgi:Reverse transcriptase (RNA-dependent DNA polymerase)